jgi:Lipase (class 3)/RTX calcium-binding nonapeptide repeat (4 copies)
MTLSIAEYSIFANDAYQNRTQNGSDVAIPCGAEVIESIDSSFGFSANAYKLDGQIVIAFAGTNQLTFEDPFFGWPLANGDFRAPQAILAIAFYKNVLSQLTSEEESQICLTGHSLGGGLAGYVAALYQKPAQIFDHMPFADGLVNCYTYAQSNDIGAAEWREFLYGDQPVPTPSLDAISAHHITGEVNEWPRSFQDDLSTPLELPSDVDLPDVPFFGEGIARHSMGFLSVLQWGNEHSAAPLGDPASSDAWKASMKFTFPKLFDDSIADSVGLDRQQYVAFGPTPRDRLISMLAYSIDTSEGSAAGNSGALAFLNNSIVLGQAVLEGFQLGSAIGATIVQHAGFMVTNYVVNAHTNDLMEYTTSHQVGELRIHFDDATWTFFEEPVSYNAMTLFLDNFGAEVGGELGAIISNFDGWWSELVFVVSNQSVNSTVIADSFWVGTGHGDTILGSSGNDIIYAGTSTTANSGTSIFGGQGEDILFGSRLDDTIDTGVDADFAYGGEGADTFRSIGEDGSFTSGGSGNDTFYFDQDTLSGFTFVFGGSGADTYDINGYADVIMLNIPDFTDIDQLDFNALRIEAQKYADSGIVIINSDNSDSIRLNGEILHGATYAETSNYVYNDGDVISGSDIIIQADIDGDGTNEYCWMPDKFVELFSEITSYGHQSGSFQYLGSAQNGYSTLKIADKNESYGDFGPPALLNIHGFSDGIAGINISGNGDTEEFSGLTNHWVVDPYSWNQHGLFEYHPFSGTYTYGPGETGKDFFSIKHIDYYYETNFNSGRMSIETDFFAFMSKIVLDWDDVVVPPWPDGDYLPEPPPQPGSSQNSAHSDYPLV